MPFCNGQEEKGRPVVCAGKPLHVKTKCYSDLLALHRIVDGYNDSRRTKINAKKYESVVSEILPKWRSQTKVRDDSLKIYRQCGTLELKVSLSLFLSSSSFFFT